MTARNLSQDFIHLGRGAGAVPQPAFDGMAWYEGYGARHGDDGAEGRLVSQYAFTESWDSWEMHPAGAEVVICTAVEIELLQELDDGTVASTTLGPGDYAINPPGIWHTANVAAPCTCIFITPGEGTSHRPR